MRSGSAGAPASASRIHPLQRPKFGELPAYARPGDIVHISEMFRLVRGTQGTPAIPAQRKARREYENRVNALPATAGP
ncbi:hypothetical protein [Streptosporangium sp. NPDC002607]